MRQNIPEELRALPQWVVSNENKEPYNPKNGQRASVSDPNTWGSYDEAIRAGFKNVGFVLAAWDPYTIIDLDDKPEKPISGETKALHNKILESFQTYTELSTNGRGYHLIVKGNIPSGVHRDSVEVYSSGRYMICTGNVVNPLPISDQYQGYLDAMYGQMKAPTVTVLDDYISDQSDMEIVEIAMNASNGEKFNSLCSGEMAEYPSQSEADLALLSIIGFYTRDNEQVRRIFRMTSLGKREKAIKNDTYLNYALSKIRANEPPPIDLSAIAARAAEASESRPGGPERIRENDEPLRTALSPRISRGGIPRSERHIFPPGFVGEVADYVLDSAFMPIPEVALAAAITLVGAIVGRQYNLFDQGIGQYVVLLAETGKGKEGAASGIDRLLGSIRARIPMVDELRGPSAFASGPATIRSLADKPSMLSIQGEFGFTISRMNAAKTGSPEFTLKQALMDIYTKSGWKSTVQSTAYSDKEKNTVNIHAPNLNILGESTQVRFFEGLDLNSSDDGLIPRLLLLEHVGDRPFPNWGHGFEPSQALQDKLATLVATAMAMKANNQCFHIRMDDETYAHHQDYTEGKISEVNKAGNSATVMLRTRSAAMVGRLAGLIAVGVNPTHPIVTCSEYEWAKMIVARSLNVLESRFESGDIGDGDSKQLADLRKVVENYFTHGHPAVKDFIDEKSYKDGLLAYRYLVQRTANRTAFKSDRLGATNALKRTLQILIDTSELVEVSNKPTLAPTGTGKGTGKCYGLGSQWKWTKKLHGNSKETK